VFSGTVFRRYVDRLCADIEQANLTVERMGGHFERSVDSIYLGGGTPTVLDFAELQRVFTTISQNFDISSGAEITVECAPGTLTSAVLQTLQCCGVNRVSLGVQSFMDLEAAAVGRLHTRAVVLEDIARLREAGIANINLDLIAGLPHQTAESWQFSLDQVIESGAPHASVYMLEIDEDSRLGRELMAGGTRYHAHFVPDEDLTVALYESAREQFNAAGLRQYEISNFARDGAQSRHNLKYWTRQPYLGFGVDAHSMLPAVDVELDSVRFASPDSLEKYVAGGDPTGSAVSSRAALEETFFTGLRLNAGVDLEQVREKFGGEAVSALTIVLADLEVDGLLAREGRQIYLTSRGRLLSNEVFEKFVGEQSAVSN